MLRVLKNEIIKMFSGKKFYVLSMTLIISIIVMAFLGKIHPNRGMNTSNFVFYTLLGTLLKPLIPMFMVLVITDTFTEDYIQGTMKFSLMAPIKKIDLIIGKFLFIAIYGLILLAIGFVGSYIIGVITFGVGNNGEFLNGFINNIKVYASIILPLFSFSAVISFIAVIINNSGAMIGLGIGIDVMMMMIDSQVKNIMYYTFSGGMYAYRIVQNLNDHNILMLSLTACVYIAIFLILSIGVVKRKDIVL
ncbi:membrane protein [Clostridium botulinum]|uniref:ABC transporter permease n=1 Tax=Clostridium botulinum TaxID=1491 RepID=UPI0005F8CE1A|nr:ABC transporter permease [Clostridium botulinum]KOM98268.1 membrane protein [Clostridium botulinum]KON00484.1 membrane protein [Clostridium botulinum]MBY7003255.1 ABC transporter permease [Clostridium botulinum]MCC5438798.1 ABC transporter permease [Clostridium botulinum]MCR1146271.1 ABC transporter permease [Clostridium botulinum]